MMGTRFARGAGDLEGEPLLTLVASLLIDLLLGEPPSVVHPVVGIGRLGAALERRAPMGRNPAAQFAFGGAVVAVVVGTAAGAAALTAALLARLPPLPRLLLRAALLKPTFAGKDLLAAPERVRALLEVGDLAAARGALRSLVSRDPSDLEARLVAAAAIESLAENASDSIVAPCLAFLLTGLPGAYAYRAANTLDAMVGYRGRYEYLGKPAARFDDLLNVVPARLTALLIAAAASPEGGARSAVIIAVRDHGATASPNAGWPMAAMAGGLRVRLEKVGHYALGPEHRPPGAADVAAASQVVARLVAAEGIGLGVVGLAQTFAARRGDAACPRP